MLYIYYYGKKNPGSARNPNFPTTTMKSQVNETRESFEVAKAFCDECGGVLIFDNKHGEHYCGKCGLVHYGVL